MQLITPKRADEFRAEYARNQMRGYVVHADSRGCCGDCGRYFPSRGALVTNLRGKSVQTCVGCRGAW
jgi:hypothetical protein